MCSSEDYLILLNVGSGGGRHVPAIFAGWDQHTLDIDPNCKPDIVKDARKLKELRTKYDAVYSSHNIEHFHQHEVPVVLSGIYHVLKPTGFLHLACPDMRALMDSMQDKDIEDVWYVSSGGPITFLDVIYGWQKQVAIGNEFYCHKTGFTKKSLGRALNSAGFAKAYVAQDGHGNLVANAFKETPTRAQLKRLGI